MKGLLSPLWLSLSLLTIVVDQFSVAQAQAQAQDPRDVIPSSAELIPSVEFSELVYQTEETPNWGNFTPIIFRRGSDGSDNDDTEYAVGLYGTKIYIGFQGSTNEADDWWANANMFLGDFDIDSGIGGQVHRGYYNKVFGSWNVYGFLSLLSDYLYDTYSGFDGIVVTGHSQGGAFATLFGIYEARQHPERTVTVYSMGSPRIGNDDFKQSVRSIPNLTIFRMVMEDDAVARLPYRFLSYRHVGHLLHMKEDGETKAYFQQTGDSALSYSGVPDSEWNIDWTAGDPITDHLPESYLAALDLAMTNTSLWPTDFEAEEPPLTCCRRFIICLEWC